MSVAHFKFKFLEKRFESKINDENKCVWLFLSNRPVYEDDER